MYHDLTPQELIEQDPSLLEDARDHIATMDVPGTPDVSKARLIVAAGIPHWCGTRQVRGLSVEDGKVGRGNGHLRSDAHIAYFEVRAPFNELDPGVANCPDCGATHALYTYSANHHIAGYESIVCQQCDWVHYNEEW